MSRHFLRFLVLFSMTNLLDYTAYAGTTLSTGESPAKEESFLRDEDELNDPLEYWNRAMLEFNRGIDMLILAPAIESYRLLTPPVFQTALTNVLRNVAAPVTVFNYIFQGEGEKAALAFGRLLVNTILGIGGLFDVATEIDLVVDETDFGETLRSWGGGPGMYVVWPILGPSIARDSCGMWVDFFLNPLNLWLLLSGRDTWLAIYDGVYLFEQKNQYFDLLEKLHDTSIDYYSALKSLYRQKRAPHEEKDEDPNEEEEVEEEPRPLEALS